jgi:hypothetical protein
MFDHVKKNFGVIPTGPASDKRLADLVASQRKQVATSGVPSPR